MISAHADVDADEFARLTNSIHDVVSSMTLYVNRNDWALWTSKWLRLGKARAGDITRTYEHVDIIDTTGLDKANGALSVWWGGWNHDVFVRNPVLFGEITRLLIDGRSYPHDRTPVFKAATTGEGKRYWRYDPGTELVAVQ